MVTEEPSTSITASMPTTSPLRRRTAVPTTRPAAGTGISIPRSLRISPVNNSTVISPRGSGCVSNLSANSRRASSLRGGAVISDPPGRILVDIAVARSASWSGHQLAKWKSAMPSWRHQEVLAPSCGREALQAVVLLFDREFLYKVERGLVAPHSGEEFGRWHEDAELQFGLRTPIGHIHGIEAGPVHPDVDRRPIGGTRRALQTRQVTHSVLTAKGVCRLGVPECVTGTLKH